MPLADGPAADGLDLLARVHRTGRVGGRHEEQCFGVGRPGRLEVLDARAEPGRLVGGHVHRRPAGEPDRLGVGGPVRGEHDDLVAGVAQHGERVGHRLLAAVGDQHLGGRDLEARVALGLGRDGLAQRRDTAGRRVTVVGRVAAGLDRGLDDVGRRREVRLAGAEADDVLPRRLQRLRLRIDGEGGRGRHGGGPAGDPAELGRGGSGRHGCHDLIRARHPRHHDPPLAAPLRRAFRVRAVQGPPRTGRRTGRGGRNVSRHQPPPEDGQGSGGPGARRHAPAVLAARRLRGRARQRGHDLLLGRRDVRADRGAEPAPELRGVLLEVRRVREGGPAPEGPPGDRVRGGHPPAAGGRSFGRPLRPHAQRDLDRRGHADPAAGGRRAPGDGRRPGRRRRHLGGGRAARRPGRVRLLLPRPAEVLRQRRRPLRSRSCRPPRSNGSSASPARAAGSPPSWTSRPRSTTRCWTRPTTRPRWPPSSSWPSSSTG